MVCNILGQFLLKPTMLYSEGNTEYKVALWKAWGNLPVILQLADLGNRSRKPRMEEKHSFSKLLRFLINIVTAPPDEWKLRKQLKGVADGAVTGFTAGDGKTPSASASVQWDIPTAPTELTEVLCGAIAGGANPAGPLGGYVGVICELGFLLPYYSVPLLSCDFSTSTVWLGLSVWFINCE